MKWDKINRPPIQCTVVRKDELTDLSPLSETPREKNTVVFGAGGCIPPEIQAHIDKVSKMRIFGDDEPEHSRE